MTKKTFHLTKTKLFITLFSVLILGMVWLTHEAMYENNVIVVKVSPVGQLVSKVVALNKTGGMLELTAADLNSVATLYMKNGITSGQFTAEGIYFQINEGRIELFAPVRYMNFSFIVRSEIKISLEKGEITVIPENTHVGKIQIPAQIVLDFAKRMWNEVPIEKGKLILDMALLPFSISEIELSDNTLSVAIPKTVEVATTIPEPTGQPNTNSSAGNSTKTPTNATRDLLIKTRNQLVKVKIAVKTEPEKQIISEIITVIAKVIDNANYPYQNEASAVKANYGKLSETEKSDLQTVILTYLDASSLIKLQSIFKL